MTTVKYKISEGSIPSLSEEQFGVADPWKDITQSILVERFNKSYREEV